MLNNGQTTVSEDLVNGRDFQQAFLPAIPVIECCSLVEVRHSEEITFSLARCAYGERTIRWWLVYSGAIRVGLQSQMHGRSSR